MIARNASNKSNVPKTLVDYFETDFTEASTGQPGQYLTDHRYAVQHFRDALGPGILIGDVDQDVLDLFVQALVEKGYPNKTIRLYRKRVGDIVLHYEGLRFRELRAEQDLRLQELREEQELKVRELRKEQESRVEELYGKQNGEMRSKESKLAEFECTDESLLWVVNKNRFLPERLAFKSESTKTHYRLALENLDTFLGRPARVVDLTDQNVVGMMAWLVDTGRSIRTANNRRDYLLAFWRWCARKRLVEEFPDVDPLEEPDVMPTSWSKEQLGKLLDACSRQTGEIASVKASDWWIAIHRVWWDTAERTGATFKMEWQHFDSKAGTLYLPGDVRKANKKALYNLKPQTVAAIEAIRAPERKLIFEFKSSFCLGTFYNRYTRLLKDAGLPHGRRDKPQKMRRSFASHLEAAGGNATEALQHSSRAVTCNSYLDERIVKTEAPNLLLFDVVPSNGDGEQNGNGKPSEPEPTADADESADELPDQR